MPVVGIKSIDGTVLSLGVFNECDLAPVKSNREDECQIIHFQGCLIFYFLLSCCNSLMCLFTDSTQAINFLRRKGAEQ